MFHSTCIYGEVFETIVPKDNSILAGRNRMSHPVIIDMEDSTGENTSFLRLNLILLGGAVKYIPYFFYALRNGGAAGILKQRIPYTVRDVLDGEKSILIDEQTIRTPLEPDVWEYEPEDAGRTRKNLLIRASSPLRIKVKGAYANRINAADFARTLHRRMQILCSQYGSNDSPGDYAYAGGWDIVKENLAWRDFTRYSARQKEVMRLGGLMGDLVLRGDFLSYEYAFLKFAALFHAGKNTNFGLGKLEIWEQNG
jgi:hypothetical protein